MDSLWLELLLIVAAILANGFFAGSEFALVSVRSSRLAQLRDQAIRGAATALKLKETPETFLATIQIAITMVGTLASVLGGATAVEALTPWLARLPVAGARDWAEPVALGLVVIVITYLSLVLGELAPKAIALRNPERLACVVAGPIARLSRISSGLVRVLTVSTNVVLHLLGQRPSSEAPAVSEEEVRYLVREGAAKGVFEKVEEELVHNVFEFGDTTVREIMTPRPNIQAIDIATPPAEVLRTAAAIGHSRIPVYRDSVDNPVGVLIIKDLLRVAAAGATPALPALLHPPLFIPESSRITRLLTEFQRNRQYLALVVDEYGGLVGLVTLEDLLEEIVGELREEGEAADPSVATRLPDGSYVLDGTASIFEVGELLGLSIDDSPEYTTVAGLLIHALGAIPVVGAAIALGGHRWTVVEMDGPRIVKVNVRREEPSPTGGAAQPVH